MQRPNELIAQLESTLTSYINWLEGNLQRATQSVFPNVKEFDPKQVPAAILFIEKEQKPAPDEKHWYKNWLTWVAVAILVGYMLLVEFMGD